MTELMNKALISIFLSFPEAILILLLGFVLTNMRVEMKKIVLMGSLGAIISFAEKILNFSLGLHTIVQIVTLTIIVSLVLNIYIYKAIVPVLIGIFIQGIAHGLLFSVATQFFNFDYTRLGIDFRIAILFYLPILLISVVLFLIVKKKNFTLL